MTHIKDEDETRKNEAECRLLPEKVFSINGNGSINGNANVEFSPNHHKNGNGYTIAYDEEEEDFSCGLGPCSPKWLQMFANKKAFLVTFCITWVLQGMYYTYFVSVITTIEKLFQLQSKTTGIIMSATEIGQIGSSLLLTYYGGQGHRPRWIACGMVMFALSSFACALPHFIFGDQPLHNQNFIIPGGNGSDMIPPNLCNLVDTEFLDPFSQEQCKKEVLDEQLAQSKITTIVLAIFFISLLGVGMGQTAVYTLGIPYIDDNVANRESPLYFAITIGVRILGPSLGFILGSFCTRLYVDLSIDPRIDPSDPRWIGAWWLGLVLVAAMLMLASIAMFSFPKKLTKSEPNSNGTVVPIKKVTSEKNPSLKDFPKAVKRLLKNDILMYRTASSVLHILPIAGLYTFLPKYFESQFRLPAHTANMVSGVGGILVMGVGIIISGVFILKVKPNARFVAAWIALTAVIYAIGMGILMFVGCPMDDFAGLMYKDGVAKFEPLCKDKPCYCDHEKFNPICGNDGRTYFSACHAGCQNVTVLRGKVMEFSGCSCINDSLSNFSKPFQLPILPPNSASAGPCKNDCDSFKWYIALFSFFVFIHSTSEVGSMLLILRCVDPKDKAMALGLIQFAIGLFGNVPCPIVYGAVVDSACLIWETACGKKGACSLYDTDTFRTFYHGTTSAILLCAFLVDMIVWYKAGSINFEEEQNPALEEDEMKSMTEKIKPETCV